jgi:hypothetical protein
MHRIDAWKAGIRAARPAARARARNSRERGSQAIRCRTERFSATMSKPGARFQ